MQAVRPSRSSAPDSRQGVQGLITLKNLRGREMVGGYTYTRSFVCAEDIPAARFITLTADGEAALTAAKGTADGVSVDSGEEGEVITVALHGPAFVEVTGDVADGRRVEAAASGRAVVETDGEVLGVCVTAGLARSEERRVGRGGRGGWEG